MKFSAMQKNLSEGLSIVNRAVPSRTTLPVTQNVYMATERGRLRLTATNLEISITTWIGAQVEISGAITVPAKLITELINFLPSQRIDLEMESEPLRLTLNSDRHKANINVQNARDFPPIPTVGDGAAGKMDSATMRDAIRHVAFAAASDDSRPILTGTLVEMSDNHFAFAATDAHRLAVYEGLLIESSPEEISFIVPAKTLLEIGRFLDSSTAPVEFTIAPEKNLALFRLNNIEVVSNLLQGKFPNYRQIIPEGYMTRAVMSKESIVSATTGAAPFAQGNPNFLRLVIENDRNEEIGKVSAFAQTSEMGDYAGEMDAVVNGDDAKIAFINHHLSKVLDVLEESQIALEMNTASTPGVIKPATQVGDCQYTYVLIPMFVDWGD